ncbi:MAG: hypothetical protein FWE24_11005 [Defluviitaleaceae bacterium]|nr:hypothetical protein [Defluviitaleaceae bacterium]
MTKIAFLSEGRINILEILDGDTSPQLLNCMIADKYKEREREIRLKNEWKHSGAGAMFTGSYLPDMPDSDMMRLAITGLSKGVDERLIYAINFENGGGVYFKPIDQEELETPILVNMKTRFYELDINPSGNIAVSCAEGYFERHIALLKIEGNDLRIITEGDSSDCNPKWSKKDGDKLYYDSAGIAFDNAGNFAGYGPRSIYSLHTKTGDFEEILTGDKYDYSSPFEDKNGYLYYIRRPYKQSRDKMSFKDFVLAPFRILRAFGAMLDLFTRRYTGESLKTSGANPAKLDTKSPQQIFIDGNLYEADKILKENAAAGDKNPGYAPRSWELVKRTPEGEEQVVQKSVMSYMVTDAGIVYSNGKYIISDTGAVKVHLAGKICEV